MSSSRLIEDYSTAAHAVWHGHDFEYAFQAEMRFLEKNPTEHSSYKGSHVFHL